jgi:hypothetical protein
VFVFFLQFNKPIQHGCGGNWALVVRRRVSDNFRFGLFSGCFGRFVFRTVSVTSTQAADLLFSIPRRVAGCLFEGFPALAVVDCG